MSAEIVMVRFCKNFYPCWEVDLSADDEKIICMFPVPGLLCGCCNRPIENPVRRFNEKTWYVFLDVKQIFIQDVRNGIKLLNSRCRGKYKLRSEIIPVRLRYANDGMGIEVIDETDHQHLRIVKSNDLINNSQKSKSILSHTGEPFLFKSDYTEGLHQLSLSFDFSSDYYYVTKSEDLTKREIVKIVKEFSEITGNRYVIEISDFRNN